MLVRAVHGIEVDESGLLLFAEAHADGGFTVDPDLSVNEVMPLRTQRTLDLKDSGGTNAYRLAGNFYGSTVFPMASDALTIRLMKTCWIWLASTVTLGSAASRSMTSFTRPSES